jgi:ATP-binding cassette subfamily B (MDR/TAP) protein 1
LNEFSLSIEAGESVAIVGESGCGKSTTVAMLMRYFDPQDGQVSYDGVNIRDLDVDWLRKQFGYVGQEPVLFDTTIR